MHITIELRRWMTSTPPAIMIDLSPYPRNEIIKVLTRLAAHDFGNVYERFDLPRDSATPTIEAFFRALGPEDADRSESFPPSGEEGDGFQLRIRTVTKETLERQGRMIDEMFENRDRRLSSAEPRAIFA